MSTFPFPFSLDWYHLLTQPSQSLLPCSLNPYLPNNQDLPLCPQLDSYFRLVLSLVCSKGLRIGGGAPRLRKVGVVRRTSLNRFFPFWLERSYRFFIISSEQCYGYQGSAFKSEKYFVRPSFRQFVIRMVPKVFLSGNGAAEHARPLNDPGFFQSVQNTEWWLCPVMSKKHSEASFWQTAFLFPWMWALCWHLKDADLCILNLASYWFRQLRTCPLWSIFDIWAKQQWADMTCL